MNRKKSKVILVGHGGCGKDYLAEYLIEKGFNRNIAYTTRPQREGEINGEDYFFINSDNFETKIDEGFWHEYNIFIPEKKWYYGSSQTQYDNCNLFIKEPNGVSLLKDTEREDCFVIYINISEQIRRERMSVRKKNADSIERRIEGDKKDFDGYTNFDYEINEEKFNTEQIYNVILSVNNGYL